MTDTSADRLRRSYGPTKCERLARIKAEYDPSNLFRSNAKHPARLTSITP